MTLWQILTLPLNVLLHTTYNRLLRSWHAYNVSYRNSKKKRINKIATSYGRAKHYKKSTNNYRQSVSSHKKWSSTQWKCSGSFSWCQGNGSPVVEKQRQLQPCKQIFWKPISAGWFNSIKNSEIYHNIAIHSDKPVIPLGRSSASSSILCKECKL